MTDEEKTVRKFVKWLHKQGLGISDGDYCYNDNSTNELIKRYIAERNKNKQNNSNYPESWRGR